MKRNRIFVLCIFSFTLLWMTGCNPSRKWEKEEQMQIENYLGTLGDTIVVSKPSGLYYIELQAGTGIMPIAKDTVSIRYIGSFLDRSIFATNLADTTAYSFIVGAFQVIDGIDEGVRYMKEGGKTRLLTPSKLAYGTMGYGAIPGYTPLLWEIELVKVKPGSKK
jgi:FKBP-type peptidyl-prolyl cis-trans isomerase